MKKITALILAVATILTLASCSFLGGLGKKDYEAEPETFTYYGLEITLTEAFYTASQSSEGANYISTSETDITVLRMPFDEYAYVTSRDAAYNYCYEMEDLYNSYDATVRQVDGIWMCEGVIEVLGFEYTTLVAFYDGTDAMWSIIFMCEEEDYDVYEEHFIKWANTVVVP